MTTSHVNQSFMLSRKTREWDRRFVSQLRHSHMHRMPFMGHPSGIQLFLPSRDCLMLFISGSVHSILPGADCRKKSARRRVTPFSSACSSFFCLPQVVRTGRPLEILRSTCIYFDLHVCVLQLSHRLKKLFLHNFSPLQIELRTGALWQCRVHVYACGCTM